MRDFYIAYWDTYGTGTKKIIHIPPKNAPAANASGLTEVTMYDVAGFDNTYTWITRDDATKAALEYMGFSDCISRESEWTDTRKLYVAPNAYIQRSGNYWHYYIDNNDSGSVWMFSSGDYATTFFNYNEPSTYKNQKYKVRSLETVHYTFTFISEGAGSNTFGPFLKEFWDLAELYTYNPYEPGGNSTTGGGGGGFSFPADTVDFPALPTLSASDSGFITLYNPTTAQVQALATYFWQTLDLTQLKELFSNPMDAVIGLNIVPVSPTTGAAQTINIGNVATTVSANVITNQYKEVDCGSVTVSEYWGAYLDYDGFTRCEIYLPYVGIHELNMSEIMGKTVAVKYHVDVLSGSCVAYVKCGDNVLYSFPGTCSVEVPVTASKFGSMLSAAASMATTAIGRVAEALGGILNSPKDVMTSVFNAGRTKVEKSGSIGGSAGIMSIQYPYLIFTYPNQCVPEDQNVFTGYPAFITSKLEDLEGYTEVENIHLTGIPATSAELEEIADLLSEGVIL